MKNGNSFVLCTAWAYPENQIYCWDEWLEFITKRFCSPRSARRNNLSLQCPKGDNSSERESLPSFLLSPNAKKKRRRKQSGNRKARTTFSYIPPQRGELGMNGAIYDADILRFYLPYEYCLPERGKRAAVFDGKRDKPIRGRYSPSRCLLPRLWCCSPARFFGNRNWHKKKVAR